MPKVKTKQSAAKRFSVTKTGKFKRSKGFRGHLKTSKHPKRRRGLRANVYASESDQKRVEQMLPYA
jgi:large subunit ribosomal protein L35